MELYERKECVSIRKVATIRYTIKVCILKEGLSVRTGKSEREKKSYNQPQKIVKRKSDITERKAENSGLF